MYVEWETTSDLLGARNRRNCRRMEATTATEAEKNQPFKVAALYKFCNIEDPSSFRYELKNVCEAHGVTGTVVVAKEGLNGTIASSPSGLDVLLQWLRSIDKFNNIDVKLSFANKCPFYRLRISVKEEIVTMGCSEICLGDDLVTGQYVDSTQWNQLITNPKVTVVDTRNDYEVELGTFRRAVNPNTKCFRDFPQFVQDTLEQQMDKHKPVAMFCTGGIRCEKASAYMLQQGFKNVYHLKGGILKYLETVDSASSLWDGDCFVFDQRVTVTHGLEPGQWKLCRNCRHPLRPAALQHPHYEEGVSCKQCFVAIDNKKKQALLERNRQIRLAAEKNIPHLGFKYKPHQHDLKRYSVGSVTAATSPTELSEHTPESQRTPQGLTHSGGRDEQQFNEKLSGDP